MPVIRIRIPPSVPCLARYRALTRRGFLIARTVCRKQANGWVGDKS